MASASPENTGPLVFDAPATERKSGSTSNAPDGVATKTAFKKNANAGLLPAGAFAPFALLNGVDAGTGTTTQSNPMPVLMRITDQATLPGSAKYHLKSCFALGTAYGDMSAERVYGRVSRISCVDKSDRLILSQEVQGYLVDSDGKLGLRGMITDRQGAKMGKALLAGFAQGLAGALGSAQGSVTTNSALGTSTNSITGDAALRAAGLAGAQNATSQLAQFYLKEAQSIFPVITVDAGRTGTLVFSASTALAWADGDSQFVQQVTPTATK
jgi:conjugal transfer pilus assembly protein TraB